MKPRTQGNARAFALCGGALAVMLASIPAAMSPSTSRGFVLPKFAIGFPLALMAVIAAVWVARPLNAADRRTPLRDVPLALGVLLSVCVMLSASQAEAWQTAWLGGYFRLEGALSWLSYLAAFFAARIWVAAGGSPIVLIDAMLASSIAPAAYAIEQRFGLDLVVYVFGDPARSAGTMGNPMFLGAYLAMCAPMTLVRQGMPGVMPGARVAWWGILALQTGGLLATGSRGALLALMAALAFLGCAYGAWRGRRRLIVVFTLLSVVSMGCLAWINLTDVGRTFARGTATLSRFVYDREGRDPATRSIHARLAAWTAGEASLEASPMWRLLTGWGPDVAHEHFYSRVPVEKIRAEDFRSEQVIDRVHADLIDTTASLGLVGMATIALLFALSMRSAVEEVFGAGRKSANLVIAAGFSGMVGAWLLCDVIAPGAARWPVAGVGFVAGYLLALLPVAWHGAGRRGDWHPEDRAVNACASVAIMVFWTDAQVGLPVFVTRIGFFVLMAVMLTPKADAPKSGPALSDGVIGSTILTAAITTTLCSFLPAFGLGREQGLSATGMARALPLAALVLLGYRAIGCRHPSGRRGAAFGFGIAWAVILLLAAVRYSVPLPSSVSDWIGPRAAVEVILPAVLWVLPLMLAWHQSPAGNSDDRSSSRRSVLACTLVLGVAIWPIWKLTLADVARSGAMSLKKDDVEARMGLTGASIGAAPWEWQYRYALVYEALPAASAAVFTDQPGGGDFEKFRRLTSMAEQVAREGLLAESPDPWRPFLMGVVLQLQGLSTLAKMDPGRAGSASRGADTMLSRAHALYPVHPSILEHLVTLKFDRGDVPEALRLLDRLEELIPAEPEPYVLRVMAGRRLGLPDQIARGVEAAKKSLQVRELQQVLDVAD